MIYIEIAASILFGLFLLMGAYNMGYAAGYSDGQEVIKKGKS